MSDMRFRLTWYATKDSNKYSTSDRFEYLGNDESIWQLWYLLKEQGYKHINIYSLEGTKQEPQKGLAGLVDYCL